MPGGAQPLNACSRNRIHRSPLGCWAGSGPQIHRWQPWSMNSFPVELEPEASPRLAAMLLLLHLAAAALPWMTHCTRLLALSLSGMVLAGLVVSLAGLPGPHRRLQRAGCRDGRWQVRLQGLDRPYRARVGPATRVHAGWVFLDLRTEVGRLGWLLQRAAVQPDEFRRLKARLRLA